MKHLALFIEPTSTQLNIFSAFTLPRLGSFILAGLVNRRASWRARVFIEGRRRFDLQAWIAEHGHYLKTIPVNRMTHSDRPLQGPLRASNSVHLTEC